MILELKKTPHNCYIKNSKFHTKLKEIKAPVSTVLVLGVCYTSLFLQWYMLIGRIHVQLLGSIFTLTPKVVVFPELEQKWQKVGSNGFLSGFTSNTFRSVRWVWFQRVHQIWKKFHRFKKKIKFFFKVLKVKHISAYCCSNCQVVHFQLHDHHILPALHQTQWRKLHDIKYENIAMFNEETCLGK